MFTKFLKIFLYLILFTSAIWGTVFIAGPTALKFIVNKTFGDTVTLYNLRFTPTLDVLVSRIEIKGARLKDIYLDGSLRSFEMEVKDFFELKPKVSIIYQDY